MKTRARRFQNWNCSPGSGAGTSTGSWNN